MNDRNFTYVYFSGVAVGCYILHLMDEHNISALIYVPLAIVFANVAIHILMVRLKKNRKDGRRE